MDSSLKRAFDVLFSLVLIVLLLPVIAAMAVVTVVSLRAWPFFSQERVGRHGRRFRFWKLRTLPTSVPAYATKYEIRGLPLGPWSRFIRRHHLDELPQLFLVLTGDMSLVGPRPEMPQLHEQLDTAFADDRTRVRPGCTGLWQISTECVNLIGEAPEFDRFYLRNASTRFDMWILARTIRNLFPGRRLVHLDDVPSWAWSNVALRDLDVVEPASID